MISVCRLILHFHDFFFIWKISCFPLGVILHIFCHSNVVPLMGYVKKKTPPWCTFLWPISPSITNYIYIEPFLLMMFKNIMACCSEPGACLLSSNLTNITIHLSTYIQKQGLHISRYKQKFKGRLQVARWL